MADEPTPAAPIEEIEAKRKADIEANQQRAVEYETAYITGFLKNAKQRSMATPAFKDTIQAAIDLFKPQATT
jgi:hypothetical protein